MTDAEARGNAGPGEEMRMNRCTNAALLTICIWALALGCTGAVARTHAGAAAARRVESGATFSQYPTGTPDFYYQFAGNAPGETLRANAASFDIFGEYAGAESVYRGAADLARTAGSLPERTVAFPARSRETPSGRGPGIGTWPALHRDPAGLRPSGSLLPLAGLCLMLFAIRRRVEL